MNAVVKFIERLWADPELQARAFVYAWYVSLAMMVLGYLILVYVLFFA